MDSAAALGKDFTLTIEDANAVVKGIGASDEGLYQLTIGDDDAAVATGATGDFTDLKSYSGTGAGVSAVQGAAPEGWLLLDKTHTLRPSLTSPQK